MTQPLILTDAERHLNEELNGRSPRGYDFSASTGGTSQEIKEQARYRSLVGAEKVAFKVNMDGPKAAEVAKKAADNTAWLERELAEFDKIAEEIDSTEDSPKTTASTVAITHPGPPLPVVTMPPLEPVIAEPVIKPPAARSVSEYQFPEARIPPTEAKDLRLILNALKEQFNSEKDYAPLRDEFCAISIALNEEGLWAPKFRPQPKISPMGAKISIDMTLNRDHLVIDAHWLWVNERLPPPAGAYAALLDSTQPFNFTLAAAYAKEKWKAEFRAEGVLFLPVAVQWQLCKTHTVELIDRYKALTYGDRAGTTKAPALVGRIRTVMNTWARSTRGVLGQELAYENLWLAREMLGAKAAAREIGILAGLMSGTKALEASTVRNKLRGLDTRLAAA